MFSDKKDLIVANLIQIYYSDQCMPYKKAIFYYLG